MKVFVFVMNIEQRFTRVKPAASIHARVSPIEWLRPWLVVQSRIRSIARAAVTASRNAQVAPVFKTWVEAFYSFDADGRLVDIKVRKCTDAL